TTVTAAAAPPRGSTLLDTDVTSMSISSWMLSFLNSMMDCAVARSGARTRPAHKTALQITRIRRRVRTTPPLQNVGRLAHVGLLTEDDFGLIRSARIRRAVTPDATPDYQP